jgi:glycosyltransferase involved in cell wall biosynthesis
MAVAARTQGIDDLHFVAIGDGKEREQVVVRARDLGVLGLNFEVLDPLPKSVMPAVLAAASVACSLVIDVPAMWDNSANKFFDALAAGVPLMINHEGWQADILRDSCAGLVTPAANPASATAAVNALIRDERRLAAAGAAAARLADRLFDRDRLARQMLRTLEAAVADPSRPSLDFQTQTAHA